ncbi:MAG: ribonuclease Y [Clostridia bacterium]|nr:ribonuclease Y [Clostridia bacterium]
MDPILAVILIIAAAFLALFIGVFVGIQYRKKVAESKKGLAEDEAKRIINEAIKLAESKKKESLIEAKEEILRSRQDADREIKERRSELQRQESWVQKKEEQIDKRAEQMDVKEAQLQNKIKENEALQVELADIKKSQLGMLEKISGLTVEQAKQQLLTSLESEIRHESAVIIKNVEQETKDNSEKLAREIITTAIQRVASDHVSEATVSVVSLPNDEMKGRIIGREGRNIRTIEQMTGVDLIIDDTPEAITISSFDPVRKEIARLTLERLVVDGRIHPARIEETVEKCRRDVEASIKQAGESAVFEAGIHGIHPELIKILGRLKYRTSYGQNVLDHSLEVAYIAAMMASELGLDPTQAKRAGLLHDIGKALDSELEGSHIEIGVETAKKYKESNDIIHAIQAHHGDVEAKTITACLVQAADAVSAARPGARRENIESYIKRLEKLEELANSFNGVDKCFAIQAGREIRVMVKPEVVKDDELVLLAREMAKKIENELDYPGQIKLNLVRESRAVDFAK